jgi:SP family myo-inositol transporter-like MFS transporter 13
MIVLASVMLYVGAYALGLGNVPWMQSELFPLSVRSMGSGLSTSTNWGANFIVGLTFLPMMEFLTPAWTFVIYSGICVTGWVLIWRIYPETKGLSLEETGALLVDGWGVRESLRRADER